MMNVVLFEPKIPPNTGNIARLCVGAGAVLHIIRPIGFFLDDKTMKRAGCDYWPHVTLKIHDSMKDFLSCAEDGRIFYVSKFGRQKYSEVSYQKGDYLVFGSEDSGLPKEILDGNPDKTVFIPMFGPVRSLNLSNAVAVVLYEALRQVPQ